MENDGARPGGKGETLFWQKQWAMLIENAMFCYGESNFYNEVMRVKDSLVDIKDSAKIKTEVNQYYNMIWFQTCWQRFKQAVTPNTMQHWQKIHWNRIRNEEAIHLLNYIRDTIQKKGYGLRISGGYEVGKEE